MDDPSRVVLVDMDGVLADFDRYVVDAIGAVCPQLHSAGTRSEFRLTDAFPEHRARIEAVTSRQEFFASLPLCEGAVEGWERIGAAGFRPRVCSSPLSANPWSDRAKRAWLTRHFGARVAHEAVVVDDKSRHDGIALIDDRPHIKNSARATWQHVVFDASYNRRSPAPRLLGWRDPRLPTLLTEARDRYLSR